MMNPDGSQQVRLTNHRARDFDPVCSPTGEEILFVSDRSGERDLYMMRADGLGVRPVFRTAPAYRNHPAWSPDGKKSLILNLTTILNFLASILQGQMGHR